VQSQQERRSVENGIWLCAVCASVIDSNLDGFPPEALRRWKTSAEAAAKRDSAGQDRVLQLINRIDEVRDAYFEFDAKWRAQEPPFPNPRDGRNEFIDATMRLNGARRAAFLREFEGQLVGILQDARVILGPEHPALNDLAVPMIEMGGEINALSQTMTVTGLYGIKAALEII
jgi:hypothetical protein